MRLFFRVLFTVLAGGCNYMAYACSACGCTAGNSGIGLLPQFSGHFAGIQYLYSHTESRFPSLFRNKPDEVSSQSYTTMQAWGRYQLHKRLQLSGYLPYNGNRNEVSGQSSYHKGIGDLTFILNYAVPVGKSQAGEQLLLAGAGLKLPTGAYASPDGTELSGVPALQTGTGSWDVVMNINYTRRKGRLGLNADASCILTTTNKYRYKYGNRLNSSLAAFYALQKGNWSLLPQAGIRAEYALHDYDNYDRKWLNEQTGGAMSFVTAGTQVQYRSWGARVLCLLPAYQHFAAGHVRSGVRSEASFFILF